MGKKSKELGALAVSKLTTPGLHFVGGVAGLALQITASGARSWNLRIMIGAKRRDMGLGGFPDVPLAAAKEKARAAREKVSQGIDPINDAKAAKSALLAAQAKAITFKEAAASYLKANAGAWKNIKHGQQWRNTLDTYVYPVIGEVLVADIDSGLVVRCLEPIWLTKTETATRVRQRIEAVLAWAIARGYRPDPNPARLANNLDKLLPKPEKKVTLVKHHAALPFTEMGAFMQRQGNCIKLRMPLS